MTAQTQRFREANRVAKQLIEAGEIGQILMVEEEQHILKPANLHDSKETCGRLLGHGIHSPDRLRWFLNDEAEWVTGFSKNYVIDSPHENSSMTLIQFYKGAMATIWVTFECTPPVFPKGAFHVRLIGDKGLLDVDSYGQVLLGNEKGWKLVYQQETFDFLKEPLSPVRLKSFFLQDQEFVDSILEHRQPAVTGQDGRAAVEIVLAAYESQQTRKMVHLG
jgi:predicted dehydrogenase